METSVKVLITTAVNSIAVMVTDLRRHFTYNSGGACPADIWWENDVVLTSMRRDQVASMLIQRHFGTKWPLGGFQ